MSARYETGTGNWERGAAAEPCTKPSPCGRHLPQALPHTRRQKGAFAALQQGFPAASALEDAGAGAGSCGALTEPALGRAHLEQAQPCTSQG